MYAVHSVRAVFTALAAVPGIERCDVALGSATLEHDGRATEQALSAALAVVDCALDGMTTERTRELPQL
jgi:hypothetical protein